MPSPGRYRLKVEARDFTGRAADPLMVDIVVRPALIQRRATQGTLLLAGGLLLLLIVWSYARNQRRRREALAAQVQARTRDLAEANRKLTEISYRDPLTGLANRRRLDQAAERTLEQGRQLNRPVSLLLIDLDHFKRFNDEHGHLAGDAALIWLGRCLESALRTGDLAARFGGEEFACLLPNTDLDEAVAVGERLLNAVRDGSVREFGRRYRPLTISIGVVSRQPGEHCLADLVELADQALYQAKARGRDCLVAAVSEE